MIHEQLTRAAGDGSYRVRAAAALALGLGGDDGDIPELKKLAADRAYLLLPADRKDQKQVVYPVREAAAAGLRRLGEPMESPRETLAGKALLKATRGGKNITSDFGGMRRDLHSDVRFHAGYW
jgi:hypothetical protein